VHTRDRRQQPPMTENFTELLARECAANRQDPSRMKVAGVLRSQRGRLACGRTLKPVPRGFDALRLHRR